MILLLVHIVAYVWMDSLDHAVRWTSMSVCLVFVLMEQLVWMTLISMTGSVLMDIQVKIVHVPLISMIARPNNLAITTVAIMLQVTVLLEYINNQA